jgi:hypothetical protein
MALPTATAVSLVMIKITVPAVLRIAANPVVTRNIMANSAIADNGLVG